MGRLCSVCSHDEHHLINVELVAAGGNRRVATQHGLSEAAVRRHRQEHIPALLVKARDAVEHADADDLLEELRTIGERLDRLSDLAEADGDYRTAIGGMAVLLKRVDLLARVRQIIQEAPTINLSLNAEWLELRAAITIALEPHEEARRDVLAAIQGVGSGGA